MIDGLTHWIASGFVRLSRSHLGAALKRTPIVGRLVHWASHAVLPPRRTTWARVDSGIGRGLRFRLNPRFESDFWLGRYEPYLLRRFAELLEPGAVVYDVGAHIGFWSLVAARIGGPRTRVYAFEADPENCARLKMHVAANDMAARVIIVPAAVWRKPGRVRFRQDGVDSSRSTGYVIGDGDAGPGGEETLAVSLDDFMASHPPPDIVKMDIEGAEIEALMGGESMVDTAKPVLVCEVHHQRAAEFLEQFLTSRGYRLEWIDGEQAFPRHLIATVHGRAG